MNKNKGSVLLGIMLFVLVILAIGVAYYVGKNPGNVLKDASDNIVKETQKQTDKVLEDTQKNSEIKKNTNAVISKCGFSINSPTLNAPIYSNTYLTFSGSINNTNSQILGCNWTMFEGEAGTAQLFYKNGNVWSTIGAVKIIKVSNWMTAGPAPFAVSIRFDNSGLSLSNNTPMKVVFTENNPSGAIPDTLEFPLIFKTNQITTESVKVIFPNGGEKIVLGQKYNIKWKTDGFSSTAKVGLSLIENNENCVDGAFGCWDDSVITFNKINNTGNYLWDTSKNMISDDGKSSIPVAIGNKYKIRILVTHTEDSQAPDAIGESDATFSVVSNQTGVSSLKVLSPNGGEVFQTGQPITVKWSSQNLSTSFNQVFIALHQDGNWQNVIYLTNGTLNDGTETFTIPSTVISGNYKIRIGSPVATIDQDFSDNLFRIN